jgi:SOS response regulatory protein OraA/RecX
MAKLNSPRLTPPKQAKKQQNSKKDKQATDDEVFDEDAILKEFFTQNTSDVIALMKPDLHAAINWAIPIEYCEQELINFLRGRLRQRDKRKVVDKLLKVKLLTGEDHFIFIHNEFQNALLDELGFRWFKSRMLISLRYNTEDITTIVIFTGKAPLKKHFIYDITRFGTRTLFKINAFVLINQDEKRLMEMPNPVGLAFLAAKYAAQSKGDDKKRFKLKKKVLDLVEKKGFPADEMSRILNFVFDYMLLPDKMEEELKFNIPFFQSLKSEKNMVMTKNRIDIRNAMSLNEHGITYEELVYKKNQEVAAEKLKAEKAAEKAAEKIEKAEKAANQRTVHAMLKKGYSVEQIADIADFKLSYVKELAETPFVNQLDATTY